MTIRDLREFKLGGAALDFLRERLAEGKTLSRCLLQYCDLKGGDVVTHLPGDMKEDELYQFSIGGKLPVPLGSAKRVQASDGRWMTMVRTPNMDAYLARIIRDFLRDDRSLCLFEDFKSSPTDPRIQREDERIRILGDEVYYALGKIDAVDEEKIAKTIRDADSIWHFLCVMSSLPEMRRLSGRNLTEEIVKCLAERAEKIAINAYDGEGYLLWYRRT